PRAPRECPRPRTRTADPRRAWQRPGRGVGAMARRHAARHEAGAPADHRPRVTRHRTRAPSCRSRDLARSARRRRRRSRRGVRVTSFYGWIADLAQHGWLPSDFQYPFLIRGFLSVLVLAPILGGLSHLVVTRRMAFFSAALGQAALAGVAIGLLLGEPLNARYGGMFG